LAAVDDVLRYLNSAIPERMRLTDIRRWLQFGNPRQGADAAGSDKKKCQDQAAKKKVGRRFHIACSLPWDSVRRGPIDRAERTA